MKRKKNYDIFLSYTHTNRDNAKKLASYLSDNGFDVWFDSWNLIAGDNLQSSISNAIEESKTILVLIDSNSLNNSWLKNDIETAISFNKKIVPIIEKDMETFNLPHALELYPILFIDYNNLKLLMSKLIDIDENVNISYLLKNGRKEYDKGNHNQALAYYMRALEIQHKVLGKEHPSVATSYNNLASIYQAIGDYYKALEYYMGALELQHKVLEKEHPSVATSYNNLASIYQAIGDYDKALKYYMRTLEIQDKVLGKEHPSVATSYNNLASIYQAKGDYDKALKYYMRALEIQHKVLGEEHPSVATSYNNLASIYQAIGDYDKALKYYMRALEIQHKVLGEEHPSVATSYNNLASLYNARGDLTKALVYLEQSLRIQVDIGDKLGTCRTLFNIGHIYLANDEIKKALEVWINVYNIAIEMKYLEILESLENLAKQLDFKNFEELIQNK